MLIDPNAIYRSDTIIIMFVHCLREFDGPTLRTASKWNETKRSGVKEFRKKRH